ncbi:hypothetical protein M407DRAFT_31924 [Tulasnella calospora MUT 4182]|uniref:Inositol phospholipid synthesis and fat-storage-inducing TM-domain-containing protein n=1 Tax=Tulasnella calospora MUT 4182 TaxID=1051891 RepID=A0A0C3PU96_9AGAM|nr:hypothetical protein M407DRAFT_31924 [Tulasnella calospora MUT 4182]
MPVFPRHNTATLAILTSIVVVGTVLSIKNESWLDTSNPLLSHLPHPHQGKSYFASKRTILNRVFVKYAWAWTSAVFWAVWIGADENEAKGGVKTLDQAGKWLGTTLVWGGFASWFFGPSLFSRIVALTGGECVVYMPAPQGAPQAAGIQPPPPHYIAIPAEFCTNPTIVTPESHPALFAHPPLAEYLAQGMGFDRAYKIVPKLTKGHDISGHTFLLTLSTLFLVDALVKARKGKATPVALVTQLAGWALVGLWATMLWATAVYFHTWQEKASGFVLAIVGFVFSQYPFEPSAARPPVPRIVVNERPHTEW